MFSIIGYKDIAIIDYVNHKLIYQDASESSKVSTVLRIQKEGHLGSFTSNLDDNVLCNFEFVKLFGIYLRKDRDRKYTIVVGTKCLVIEFLNKVREFVGKEEIHSGVIKINNKTFIQPVMSELAYIKYVYKIEDYWFIYFKLTTYTLVLCFNEDVSKIYTKIVNPDVFVTKPFDKYNIVPVISYKNVIF